MSNDNTQKPTGIDRLTTTVNDQLTSRRSFLAASAVVGAGAFGAMPASADHEGEEETMNGDTPPTEFVAEGDFEDDIDILNFARLLEFLEADFYRQGLENISEQDLCRGPLQGFGDPIQDRVFGDLETIRDHEITHAEVLGATVEDLGGEPIDEPEFEFGTAVEDPTEFLALGATLEDTGVGAYAGAGAVIENEDLVPPALSIHSVEARHASFLRVLTGEIGFPVAFDQPLSRAEVEAAASQFIVE